jgi:hypothetical protein
MRMLEDSKHKEAMAAAAADGSLSDRSPLGPAAFDIVKQAEDLILPKPADSAPAAPFMRSADLRPETSEERQAESLGNLDARHTASATSPVRRPLRKAAARAATRTAEFAHTGEYPDEGDVMSPIKHHRGAAARHDDHSSGSDMSQHNSDAAEEVAFHQPPRFDLPTSPMQAVGQECAAAVNLLSMSVKETDIINSRRASTAAAAGTPRRMAVSHGTGATAKPRASMGTRTTKVASSYGNRTGERPPQLQALDKELHAALQEAASADAVVAAVAQILAIKQAAATRANAAVEAVNRQIRDLEAELMGGPAPSRKRQRRSL